MGLIDPGQLGRLFEQLGGQLGLYARQWLDAALAEDVVQDAFVKLISQRKSPENVRGWLFRVVRNEAISRLRRQKSHRAHVERVSAEEVGWFEPRADDLIDAEAAQQAMESLTTEQREVVVLRIWGQMSLKEIAEIVGRPVSTVHSRYKAALAAMREYMEISCKTNQD